LARRFYDLGPGKTRANLAALLSTAAQNGELEIRDAEEAAEHLVDLWQGISNSVPTTDLEIPLWQSGRPRFFGRYNDCEPRLDARDQTKVPITM
jgi:hypothetical protein